MADSKKISQLTTAESLSENAVLPLALPNQQSSSGFVTRKTSFTAFATWIANVLQYASLLHTTATTIIGAINEIKGTADDAFSDASDAVTAVGLLDTDVEALQTAQTYNDADTVSLTDFMTTGIMINGVLKFFIPLHKEVSEGLEAIISGTWNTYGDLTSTGVTLASLGTVETFVEELGITVVITTSQTTDGQVLFESINGSITFQEEES